MDSGAVQVRILGRFAVSRDGREVPPAVFGGRLSRRLVRVLVCRDGELVTRDVLIDLLWGDRPPADPAANLNVLVNRARQVVGDAIRTGPGGYRLDPAVCEVDSRKFLAAFDHGRAGLTNGDLATAASGFDRALAAWTGDPLPEDLYEPWAEAPRRRLVDAHLVALEGRAHVALAEHDPALASELAGQACDRQPYREGAHVLLARALQAAGNRTRALEVLEELTDRIRSELGLDPSQEVSRLQVELLGGQASPTGRPRPRPVARTGTSPVLPFIGRDDVLGRVLSAVRGEPPRPVVVTGASGAGKSRLLEEIAGRVGAPLLVRAYRAERDQDGSLARDVVRAALALCPDHADVLHPRVRAALATLVPELEDGPGLFAVDPPSLRSLTTEGIVSLLAAAAEADGVLIVDDLQWADPSSLATLPATVARLPAFPIVVAHRPDEHPEGPADGFLAELRDLGEPPCELRLGPLTHAELSSVAAEPLAAALAEHTDGSPFALTQAVTELRRADLLHGRHPSHLEARGEATAGELAAAIRTGHQHSIRTRVQRQPRPRRELLELICLLHREATVRLLATVSHRQADSVLTDLEALARGGLLQTTDRGWTMVHELTARTVLSDLDDPRRRQLHTRLAAGLHDTDADPGEVATHLQAAGDRIAAARAHAEAAATRLSRAATEEAARHAAAGLRLEPFGRLRQRLLRLHADALAARGELSVARTRLREALRETTDGPGRAGLLARLAEMSLGAEDLTRAEELAERAILEAGTDPASRARSLSVAAVVDMNQRRVNRSRERSDEALALYRSLRDASGVGEILDARAMARFLEGDITGAITDFHRVACAFEDAGQLLRIVTPRSTRGHALVFADRPADGLADIDAAGELATVLGHAEGQAYTDWHRSEALTALGRLDDAIAAADTALATAERIEHRGWAATANLALGLARAAAGEPDLAESAYRAALRLSQSLPLFRGWAAARLARLHLQHRRIDDAVPLVDLAAQAPPALGGYEARLAKVELLHARHDPHADRARQHALALAHGGGHLASARILGHGSSWATSVSASQRS